MSGGDTWDTVKVLYLEIGGYSHKYGYFGIS